MNKVPEILSQFSVILQSLNSQFHYQNFNIFFLVKSQLKYIDLCHYYYPQKATSVLEIYIILSILMVAMKSKIKSIQQRLCIFHNIIES
jgi:hypothetical protein